MGRLNKKLTLKSKKAAKALSKAVAAEKDSSVGESKVPSKLLLEVPMPKSQPLSSKPSTVVPTKLSKISKKERRKLKSDDLKNKLTVLANQKKEAKDQIRRQKAVITGDLRPMAITLHELLEASDKEKAKLERTKPAAKKGKRRTMKSDKKDMMTDLSVFQQVLAHPQYAKDPFKTISTHIENKMLLEAMQTTQ